MRGYTATLLHYVRADGRGTRRKVMRTATSRATFVFFLACTTSRINSFGATRALLVTLCLSLGERREILQRVEATGKKKAACSHDTWAWSAAESIDASGGSLALAITARC